MAVVPAELPSTKARPITAAFKEALGAALLALGLSVPILALRTEQDINNRLVLQPRWNYVLIAVLLAFFGRLLYLAYAAASANRTPRVKTTRTVSTSFGQFVAVVGLVALVLYPWIALSIVGRAGAI
ncbi:MAG: DUF3382 domain-containing protein, partial [Hyphomicrobiaceae bacterium]